MEGRRRERRRMEDGCGLRGRGRGRGRERVVVRHDMPLSSSSGRDESTPSTCADSHMRGRWRGSDLCMFKVVLHVPLRSTCCLRACPWIACACCSCRGCPLESEEGTLARACWYTRYAAAVERWRGPFHVRRLAQRTHPYVPLRTSMPTCVYAAARRSGKSAALLSLSTPGSRRAGAFWSSTWASHWPGSYVVMTWDDHDLHGH